MKLLALTHRVPYPPDKGDRIRSYHLLSRLAARHDVSLLSLSEEPVEPAAEAFLSECFTRHEVAVVDRPRRLGGMIASLLAGDPLTFGYFRHRAVDRALRAWSRETPFDAAFLFSSSTAPYWERLDALHPTPALMDFIDVDSEKWRQYAARSRQPRRWIFEREARLLGAYERALDARVAASVLVSDAEVETFTALNPGSAIRALYNGVDLDYFARPGDAVAADPPRVVFVGAMDYHANVDAVTWFVREVLPVVREARPDVAFDVVGSNPTREVTDLASVPGVEVTGRVPDVRPYLWRARVAVAPLLIAQGTQNKVLEAMAASVPVVATSLAARGLAESRGAHLRVADGARDFAAAVTDLLGDADAASAQAGHALEFVRGGHGWDASARRLERMLESITA